ncbi:MAG: sigma-70 family RNA polymerase sigma factor [Myxococcales bacterium]|nr:sigma-70 family RNA polymerase sigma factor [Myxococcales bacterium]MCB9641851.1 sigma-70 family RNA polymerase sigma factor [Myxococcales bacterium]
MTYRVDAEFRALFVRYHDGLYRMLYQMVGARQEAEDLLQETFVRLHDHQEEVEPEKAKAWLYQVATRLGLNAMRDTKRRNRWHQEATQQAESVGATITKGDPATTMAVRDALNQLPERQTELLLMYAAGLNHEELADALGVQKSSLSQLLFRSKKAFEQIYTETSTKPTGQR